MVMYDTIHSWYDISDTEYNSMVRLLEPRLIGVCHSMSQYGKRMTGNCYNQKVVVTERRIKIIGSLPKYYYGYNYKTLSLPDTWLAIEKLSDELHLPLIEFNVSRIDFATNFSMEFKPEVYYPYLGNCHPYDRLVQPESLLYKLGLREKAFYDKVVEGKKNKAAIPKEFIGMNLLRYELRYTHNLLRQFNKSKLILSNLF